MRFLNFILTIATMFTAGSAVAAGFDSRNNPVFTHGSTADLLISADLPSETSALQFAVTLPEAFELGSENLALNSLVADQVQTRVHKENDNTYNYVLYTADNKPIDTSGDYLFGLSLRAKPTSKEGSYALRFSNIIASTPNGQETVLSEYSATLRITIPTESITLSQSTAQLKVGESIALIATVQPDEATDKTVAWISSNEAVATVDANGNVVAVALGEAEITAKCGGILATCSVKVVPTPVESLIISQSTAILKATETVQLTATVLPETATDKSVVWSTSDPTVATVSETGLVTALKVGNATITAAATSGAQAVCVVTVEPTPAESITLSQSTASLKVGESVTLTATVLPENATDKTITWSSSNVGVATVDASGKVTAVALGEAEIFAKCGGVTATCELTVLPILVETISLTPDEWSGVEGDWIQLVVVVLPDNATDKSLNWSSSNEKVATVDNTGLVSIQMAGTCLITATAADGSGIEAQCVITGQSGLDAISVDEMTEVDVYSIGGMLLMKGCDKAQLNQLTPGMYILRAGNKVIKEIVK